MLDQETMQLLRASVSALPVNTESAAQSFYARLFELAPQTRVLFKSDPKVQGKKLFDMLAWIVAHLDQPEVLLTALHDLGVRHARYQVSSDHYGAVGSALIWMFQQQLGEKFTPAMEDAWLAAYAFISAEMERGQRGVQ